MLPAVQEGMGSKPSLYNFVSARVSGGEEKLTTYRTTIVQK